MISRTSKDKNQDPEPTSLQDHFQMTLNSFESQISLVFHEGVKKDTFRDIYNGSDMETFYQKTLVVLKAYGQHLIDIFRTELDNSREKFLLNATESELEESVFRVINMQKSQLADAEKQISLLKLQLKRRTDSLKEQRSLFFKEILVLKEQLHQKNTYGEDFKHDNFEIFKPTAWLEELLGEDLDEIDEVEEIQKKAKEALDKIQKEYNKERHRLERTLFEIEREKDRQLDQVTTAMKQREAELQAMVSEADALSQENQTSRDAELRAELEALKLQSETELETLRSQLAALTEQSETNQDARIALSEKEIELADLRASEESLREALAQQSAEQDALQKRVAVAEEKVRVYEEATAHTSESESEEERLKATVTRMKLAQLAQNEKVQELESRLSLASSSFAALEAAETKVGELREEVKAKDDLIEQMKDELESKGSDMKMWAQMEEQRKLKQQQDRARQAQTDAAPSSDPLPTPQPTQTPTKPKFQAAPSEFLSTFATDEPVDVKETRSRGTQTFWEDDYVPAQSSVKPFSPSQHVSRPTPKQRDRIRNESEMNRSDGENEDSNNNLPPLPTLSPNSLSLPKSEQRRQIKEIHSLVNRDKDIQSNTAITNWHLLTSGLVRAIAEQVQVRMQRGEDVTSELDNIPHLRFNRPDGAEWQKEQGQQKDDEPIELDVADVSSNHSKHQTGDVATTPKQQGSKPSSSTQSPSRSKTNNRFAKSAFLERLQRSEQSRLSRLKAKRDQLETERAGNLEKVLDTFRHVTKPAKVPPALELIEEHERDDTTVIVEKERGKEKDAAKGRPKEKEDKIPVKQVSFDLAFSSSDAARKPKHRKQQPTTTSLSSSPSQHAIISTRPFSPPHTSFTSPSRTSSITSPSLSASQVPLSQTVTPTQKDLSRHPSHNILSQSYPAPSQVGEREGSGSDHGLAFLFSKKAQQTIPQTQTRDEADSEQHLPPQQQREIHPFSLQFPLQSQHAERDSEKRSETERTSLKSDRSDEARRREDRQMQMRRSFNVGSETDRPVASLKPAKTLAKPKVEKKKEEKERMDKGKRPEEEAWQRRRQNQPEWKESGYLSSVTGQSSAPEPTLRLPPLVELDLFMDH
ncbi:hypothetical protein BLNAU_17648 [Blattamonas nauphoetae]|uniref:Uncharacterized protein n=1 Tax=Blattamonas nauphoetae TaxID=2049346 RepID=A0ABQ9X6K3_9EUKA|nr:hypothetical protein BLNAU_17648 [Blattamonas nauphoetae]